MTTAELRELDAEVARGVMKLGDCYTVPRFTTDPAALETLKRWLREREDVSCFRVEWSRLTPDRMEAILVRSMAPFVGRAPTEALALVRAVLAAFGGDE